VFHRWHAGEVRLRTLVGCVATALVAGVALLGSAGPALAADGAAFVPMLTAWLGAYALFCLGIALRRRTVPAWLRRLGTISYSVYLVQALVLITVPALPVPLLSAVLWAGLVVALSELTYRRVEQPAVRLGRRLATGRPTAQDAPVRVHPRRSSEREAIRTASPHRLAG
jgi:peptidoglycan/LPS O-acetylase OafA/YrhL